jgi:ABC-type Fe3+-hydroxamate transport system substrate-binding protein
MAAGEKTAANEIIRLAGAVNAIEGYDGYKTITDEAIVAAKPDVVLSIERGKDTLEAEAVYAHPAFALTPVVANRSFIPWRASISSASDRARPPRRATFRSSFIRRWRSRPKNLRPPHSLQTAGNDRTR